MFAARGICLASRAVWMPPIGSEEKIKRRRKRRENGGERINRRKSGSGRSGCIYLPKPTTCVSLMLYSSWRRGVRCKAASLRRYLGRTEVSIRSAERTSFSEAVTLFPLAAPASRNICLLWVFFGGLVVKSATSQRYGHWLDSEALPQGVCMFSLHEKINVFEVYWLK